MVEVSLVDVTKRFDKTVAVETVSLTAPSNQFLTLLGPSGCGKTTILRLIAGFEHVDHGDILFDGKSILALPPERRGVGMVFQQSALFPHMNVRQNISYGLRYHRTGDSRTRVPQMLDLTGLRGLEKRRPDQLSVGQQQRVALARALAPQPRILLLDEPLSALDAKLRDSLRFEIRQIQQSLSLTTIYVTHDQIEALAASDRIAVMSMGHVEQAGTPTDIYLRPATPFTASFVGHTNRFEAVVASSDIDRSDGAVSVELQDHHFVAQAQGDRPLHPGEAVVCFVKIEAVVLDDTRENQILVTLIGMEYQGETTVVQLRSTLGSLSARIPSEEASYLRLGEKILASFAPEDTLLFRQDERSE